jgi:prepilin-type N-terminal cleavage/methylation domain-containing protein
MNDRGFTLVELLIVIAILGVMMGLGLVVWSRTAPAVRLDNACQALKSHISYARHGAIQTGDNWFVEFDLANHSYYIANDDGWLGTVTAVDQFGNKREPRSYYLGSPDFNASIRNNGIVEDMNSNGLVDIGDRELMQGPFPIGKELFFMKVNGRSITRVTFDREGKPSFTFHSGSPIGGGEVWIASSNFYQISSTNPGAGSQDDRRYRKAVKVRSGTGMILITENY